MIEINNFLNEDILMIEINNFLNEDILGALRTSWVRLFHGLGKRFWESLSLAK